MNKAVEGGVGNKVEDKAEAGQEQVNEAFQRSHPMPAHATQGRQTEFNAGRAKVCYFCVCECVCPYVCVCVLAEFQCQI